MTTVTSYGSATNLGPYMQSVPVNPLVTTTPANASIVKEGDGTAAVAFRPTGTVLRAEFEEPPPFRPGLLELARWRLDKIREARGR